MPALKKHPIILLGAKIRKTFNAMKKQLGGDIDMLYANCSFCFKNLKFPSWKF